MAIFAPMTYEEAEAFYGSQAALAAAFTPPRSQGTVHDWKAAGKIPRGAQFELQVRSRGKLQVDPEYRRPTRRRREA